MAIEKRFNRIWNGTAWVDVYSPTSADLVSATGADDTVQKHIDNTTAHTTTAEKSKLANLASDANATYATKEEAAGVRNCYMKADIAERNALTLTAGNAGDTCWVINASADATVNSGAALYGWDGTKWIKLAETESMDVITSWSDIQNKPSSSTADIDDAVTKKHTHANSAVLDALSETSGKLTYNGSPIDKGNIITLGTTAPVNPTEGDLWFQPVS